MQGKNIDAALLLQTVLDCGASGAEIVDVNAVIVNEDFRRICENNSCGAYNRCYMCPPDIGQIHELMAKVKSYDRAVLYQSIGEIDDPFDFEGMMDVGHNHALLSQRVGRAVKPILPKNHLHLSSGGCHLCEKCAKLDDLPCRHPDDAFPGMEGYGIDVYQTVAPTHMKYINGQKTVTYFGIVLF